MFTLLDTNMLLLLEGLRQRKSSIQIKRKGRLPGPDNEGQVLKTSLTVKDRWVRHRSF